MKFIKHRVNKIADLSGVNRLHGVEIDLRSNPHLPGKLHLSHDPWVLGDDFEKWLSRFCELGICGTIILNTKEDGLEKRILEILADHKLENFFFLDTALPTLVKWSTKLGESRFALRLSSFEPIESCRPFIDRVKWIWVDCFDCKPMDHKIVSSLASNFNICLVSPELQGGQIAEINNFTNIADLASAICTKDYIAWQDAFPFMSDLN